MSTPAVLRLALAAVLAFALIAPTQSAHAVWTVSAGKITDNLNAVTFVDDVVFAAGEAGTILRSADAGATWDRVNSMPGHAITGMDFADNQNGWTVTRAGGVFRTSDGGQTWSLISNDLAGPLYVDEQMHGLRVLSSSAVVVVGGAQETQPAIWTSSTGAGIWGMPHLAGSYDPPSDAPPFPRDGLGFFYGIDAVSPTRAWAVGHDFSRIPNRAIVWRLDGGNWTEQSFSGETGAFFDVSFADADAGVAVGAAGRIRSTSDGGALWTARTSGTSVALRAVSIARGASSGWAVGNAGTILRTTDSGVTWVAQASGSSVHLRDVVAMDATRGVAVGDGGLIVRTTDGGMTWSAPAPPPAPVRVRVDGVNRFETALAAARLLYPASKPMPPGPDGRRTVIIASGADWPDALAASGLGGAHRSPVLLTLPNKLPAEVAEYIGGIQADRAIIVGGKGVVSEAVRAELASIVGGLPNVRRIGGGDRYATAHLIAGSTVSVTGRQAWDGTAFVATGGDFPDALAAAPLAARRGYPIYLAHPQGIDSTVLDAMVRTGVRRVFLLGATGAVSPATESRLRQRGITIAGRWGGTDRFETGRVIAERSLEHGLGVQDMALATGRDFPDAIAGGVVQGLTGSVLLLTESGALHDQTRHFLASNAGRIESIRFVGGTSVLSERVRDSAISAGTVQP